MTRTVALNADTISKDSPFFSTKTVVDAIPVRTFSPNNRCRLWSYTFITSMPSSAADISISLYEYVALIVTTGLYAITCMQTFLYFVHHHRQDQLPLKLLVVHLWLMDTVHLVFIIKGAWLTISTPGLAFSLSRDYLWAGIFSGLVALPVQLFFLYRIWRFIGKEHMWRWLLFVVFVLCSSFQFFGYVAFHVYCLRGLQTGEVIIIIEKLPMAIWGVGAAQDVLIAATLLFVLWRARIVDDLRGSNQMLNRLSIFVVNTGLWTAACAVAIIVALSVNPVSQLYVALFFVLCPLYCNTLLANLNGRGFIRGSDSVTVRGGMALSRSLAFRSEQQSTLSMPQFRPDDGGRVTLSLSAMESGSVEGRSRKDDSDGTV
ncbi:hypothetical protein OF83DRAFT_1132460, partial [Amylostereum chailletii]